MAPTPDDESPPPRRSSRRTFVKSLGLAVTAAAGTALVGSPGAARTTVHLGEQGLEDGDDVDPYLSEFFVDGVETYVPAGEYRYSGAGIGGSKANCALVGSPDGVVFHRPAPTELVRPTLWASAGTVRIENVTVRGERGRGPSRWRVGADADATVELVNVNMPDGSVDASGSHGVYAGTDHAGTLAVSHCLFAGFGDVACDVADPALSGNGTVHVTDCSFLNTGAAALRIGADGTEVRRCYFEATERAPASYVGWDQCAIRIDGEGDGIVVADCDLRWTEAGASPVHFTGHSEGGSGVVRNVRVRNDGDDPTFVTDWDTAGAWEGEALHLTGSATHDVPAQFETVTGPDATAPEAERERWSPVEDTGPEAFRPAMTPTEPMGPSTAGGQGALGGAA